MSYWRNKKLGKPTTSVNFDTFSPIDGANGGIHFANPQKDLRHLDEPNEIVIPDATIRIRYSYGLSAEQIVTETSSESHGWTRQNLAQAIMSRYIELCPNSVSSMVLGGMSLTTETNIWRLLMDSQ